MVPVPQLLPALAGSVGVAQSPWAALLAALALVALAFGPDGDGAADALASLPDPVFALDAADRFAAVNPAFTETFGGTPEALGGKHATVVFRGEAGERLTDLAEAVREDREADGSGTTAEPGEHAVKVSVPVDDGERRQVEVRLRTRDGDGGLVGVVRDVGGRSTRRRELERYERIVETIGDPVYVADPDGTFLFVNEATEQVTGYPRDVLVGSTVHTVLTTDSVERGDELLRELVREDRLQAVLDVDLVTRSGEHRTVENKMTLLPHEEEFRGHAGVLRDVSERKRREAELKQYETIVDALGDPVFTVEPDGGISFVNAAFEETLDHDLADGDLDLVDVVADEDVARLRSVVSDLGGHDAPETATVEATLVAADGRTVPFETSIASLPGEDAATFGGTANVARDITERKEREQRLAVLNRVFRHDIRNHLAVVESGATYIAEELSGPVDETTAKHLGEEARRLARAAEELEDTSDQAYSIGRLLEAGRERTTVDIVRTVEGVVDRYRREVPDATIRTDLPGEAQVRAIQGVDVAVDNLLENALEHNVGHAEVALSVVAGDHEVRLHVDDDGPGIPEHETLVLEAEGENPMAHSSGLGLWAVTWIVRRSHGEVDFAESPLGGTRVTLSFPRG